ncbi:MAG: uroporphyrinogen-III C-methyltransferase [Verrucomicrobiota bacterium]
MSNQGVCYLVGAGPGDLGLFTLRAKELIENADVIIYDYLANSRSLMWGRSGVEIIYVGKKAASHALPQDGINELIVQKTKEGNQVVRLKGGDPFIFGRGGEEAEALKQAGLKFEIIPGVTSAVAASAYAGIPVTHRGHNTSLTLLTGHEDPSKAESAINWQALVDIKGTLAIYMGMGRIRPIMQNLMDHGLVKTTPVGVIQWGTTSKHKSITGTAETISDLVEHHKFGAPAIIIVGQVAEYKKTLSWFEDKTLLGQRIVVTRTRKQSSALAKMLTDRGAEVLEIPTIRVTSVKNSLETLVSLSDSDWFVFTSPNAVEYFFEQYLQHYDIRSLSGKRIAVVGPATAKKIQDYYLKIDLQPETYTAKALVEAWADDQAGAHVVFPCGNLAKDEIEKGLSAKNCQVSRLEVYRTDPEMDDLTGHREDLCDHGADWVIFSSSSAVENFHALNLDYPKNKCKYASLGPVTSQAMHTLGYNVDLQSKESTIPCLVEELENFVAT